jgi:hypothetical protein
MSNNDSNKKIREIIREAIITGKITNDEKPIFEKGLETGLKIALKLQSLNIVLKE